MKKKVLIAGILCVVIIGVVMFFVFSGNASYSKAYQNTKNLKDYTMEISTIVSIYEGENVKQSTVDQMVKVENKGKKDMMYSVASTATSVDMATGTVKPEENSYIYYNGAYYYSYPGVRYKNPTEFDMALSNITNLTQIISFEENDRICVSSEKVDGTVRYDYQVSYEAISNFVKGTLESAIGFFDGEKFSPQYVAAASVVDGKYITSGELYIEYASANGNRVCVEVYTELVDKKAEIEKPDEAKYVNIYG